MPINNRFSASGPSPLSPALAHYDGDALESNTVDLPEVVREIYVGVGGDVKFTDTSGFTGTFKNVPSGATLTGFFTRLWATGTTASSIVLGV